MAKHILQAQDDVFDFALFGLRYNANCYTLIAHLNQLFQVDFTLSDYLQLYLKNGKKFQFSLFQFTDEELSLEYSIIANKSNIEEGKTSTQESKNTDLFGGQSVDESTLIIPELPQTDFFLLLKGDGLFQYEDTILKLLKSSTSITGVQEIIPDELPSKRNLIL
jgi:hypothetical protein